MVFLFLLRVYTNVCRSLGVDGMNYGRVLNITPILSIFIPRRSPKVKSPAAFEELAA